MFFSINLVVTPPSVSIPSDNGVTSNSNTSLTSPCRTPPCIAAPRATTSSGLTPLCGSLPKNSFTVACTFGIRVIPPTNTTSLISLALTPASFNACLQGDNVFAIKSPTSISNLLLVNFILMCLGPVLSAVINGKLISVSIVLDNSILAFSAASLTRCTAKLSFAKSIPLSFLNSFTM